MPPRNVTRSLLTESALAARVAYEREKRGWTYDGLAKRMTDVGCAINQSGLYKVERGEPRRRITVDELVAFSQVFQIPVEHLLLSPELAASKEVAELLIVWNEKLGAADQAQEQADEAWEALKAYVAGRPEIVDKVEELFRLRAQYNLGDNVDELTVDYGVSYRMALLTGDPARRQAAEAAEEALWANSAAGRQRAAAAAAAGHAAGADRG